MLLSVASLLVLGLARVHCAGQALPKIAFETSWDSLLLPNNTDAADIKVKDGLVYSLNGAASEDEIVIFDLLGNYVDKIFGYYNFPMDFVLGENNQVLLSALGAEYDDHSWMGFGLVLYDSANEFFHGFQERETGLSRPHGLSILDTKDGVSRVAVCDWDKNQTRFLQVDWEEGRVETLPEPIIEVPYPNDVVVSGDKLLIVSTICCQDSMEPLRKAHLYDSTGALLKTAKDLPNGERMDYPNKVAVDEAGNFLVVDTGLKKTLLFSPDLEYIGDLPELGVPDAMDFYDNKVYTLSRTIHSDGTDHKVMVYSYQY